MWVSVRNGKVKAGHIDDKAAFEIGRDRYYLNPGSVGQPRDGDSRASYAMLDTGTGAVAFHRAEYDGETTQKLIEAAGLPVQLA